MTIKALTAASTAALLFFAAPAQSQPIPIEHIGKQPALSSLSLSPEGDFLVGLVSVPGSAEGDLGVAVWDLPAKIDTTKPLKPNRITPGNDKMKFISVQALGSGKLVAAAKQNWTGQTYCGNVEGADKGTTKTAVFKTYFWDKSMDPKKARDNFAKLAADGECSRYGQTFDLSPLALEEGYAVGQSFDVAADVTKYYKVNLKTEAKEFLYQDGGDVRADFIDPRTSIVRTKNEVVPLGGNDYEIRFHVLNPKTGNFDVEAPLSFTARKRNSVDIVGYDEASGQYYVSTDKFSDKVAIYFYDPAADKFSADPVFAHPEFSATGVALGSKKHNFNKPLGFRYQGASVETYWIDPEYKSIQDGLDAAFPGKRVSISGSNKDLSRVLFSTSASDSPPAFYLLIDKSKVAIIGSSRPWLANTKMSKQELVYYAARDGLQIPGILTPALGWKKGDKPAPTIILPHGGPWARDYVGWDSSGWTQFLASRGYHVLQPQYRGSTGFGYKLWTAGDNEWGQKMQDDKDDGAAWLVKEGYAAKDRIAIFGYSYGGFAAFAATVRDNSPYQCAIAGAGVSNLELFKKKVSENRISRAIQGRTMTGMSPLTNANKAQIPILVYHGDRDVRVPIKDGRDL